MEPWGQSWVIHQSRLVKARTAPVGSSFESAERFLHEMGTRECRVPQHDTLARIEVPAEHVPRLAEPENARRIDEHFRSLGDSYVCLERRGFSSGSRNEVITLSVAESPT